MCRILHSNAIRVWTFLLLTQVIPLYPQTAYPTEKCLTNDSFDNRYASYSPDGKWIVFESNREGNWGIFVMDTTGSQIQEVVQDEYNNRRPTWHPNGKRILFESIRNEKSALYVVDVKRKKPRRLLLEPTLGQPIFASYAPNGKTIAVSLKVSDEKSNIVLLNKRGNVLKKLTNNDKRNYYPKWSSNGKEMIYFSRKDTDNQDDEIYLLNLDSGKESRLTNWHKHNFCPSWSNNDEQVVYVTSMEGTRPELYIMDRDGENQRRITNNEDGETLPHWSPVENKIIFTAYRNGSFQICEIKL